MSATVVAQSILGIEVLREALFKKKLVKTCDHSFPETVLFHPQTGSKLWVERLVGKLAWMENEEDDFEYGGLSFTFSDCRKLVYVGLVLGRVYGRSNDHAKRSVVNQEIIDNIQTLIDRELLSPLGLPDTKVAVWTVLYYS